MSSGRGSFYAKAAQNRNPLDCHSCAKFNPNSLNSCFALKQTAVLQCFIKHCLFQSAYGLPLLISFSNFLFSLFLLSVRVKVRVTFHAPSPFKREGWGEGGKIVKFNLMSSKWGYFVYFFLKFT